MPEQWMAVYLKATGELVSVGTFVQGPEHCVCSHSSTAVPGHPIGVETAKDTDGTEYERPLGCTVDGCFHNYAVPTAGQEIRRSGRPGLEGVVTTVAPDGSTVEVGPVLWSDPDGKADCGFVSDPLAPDLAVAILDGPPQEEWLWDRTSRKVIVDVAQRTRRLLRERTNLDEALTSLDQERSALVAAGAPAVAVEEVARERSRVEALRADVDAALQSTTKAVEPRGG